MKKWLAASGSILAATSVPMAAMAKEIPLFERLEVLVDVEASESTCRGNDSCVLIEPDLFAENIKRLKEDIGPDVKLCIVMKSDAYAHGVENLMPEALRAKPAYIAMVGNNDIRKAVAIMEKTGMRASILRIGPATFFEAAEAVINNWPVEEIVGSLGQAEMLSRIACWTANRHGKRLLLPVHINIDTGMGRMGFVRADDINKAMALPGIEIQGVMTHYANAYDLEHGEELTKQQLEKFDALLAELDLPDGVIIHTANSGATLSFPWTRRDMVRVGGAVYGDLPNEMNPGRRYQEVMSTFLSSVVWVMEVPPNTPVGYESVYRTPKDRSSVLATVKVGYNNGLPSWAYEKETHVLIRGQRFPLVGKTSMNMVVVDVTGQDDEDKVQLGDEVVIFGRQGDQEISWEELENTTGVSTSEITITIGKVNPRIVVRGRD